MENKTPSLYYLLLCCREQVEWWLHGRCSEHRSSGLISASQGKALGSMGHVG